MNDWMDQEILRQAAEAGDPAAQTTSWAIPARRQSAPAAGLVVAVAIGVLALLAVLAVLAASTLH
jgi:hypothetical protein